MWLIITYYLLTLYCRYWGMLMGMKEVYREHSLTAVPAMEPFLLPPWTLACTSRNGVQPARLQQVLTFYMHTLHMNRFFTDIHYVCAFVIFVLISSIYVYICVYTHHIYIWYAHVFHAFTFCVSMYYIYVHMSYLPVIYVHFYSAFCWFF